MDQITLFWQSMDETTHTLIISGGIFFANLVFWITKKLSVSSPVIISEPVQNLLTALDNHTLWSTDRDRIYGSISPGSPPLMIYKDGEVAYNHHFLQMSKAEIKLVKDKAEKLRLLRWEKECQVKEQECKDKIAYLLQKSKEQA